MIDFHNHILPNVDDGAKSIEVSIEMLLEAHGQGITDVISTIHFQHPKMDGKDTSYSFVVKKCNELQKELLERNIPINIHLGAEVFYMPNLTAILDNPLVTIGNGKFMLIEFQNRILPPNFLEEFFKLQNKGITPIVAHPERYSAIQENIELAYDWMDRGFALQLDCGSILGHFGSKCKKVSQELIKGACIQLIGSDAHNNKIRNFCLQPAYNMIESFAGKNTVEKLKNNSLLLLEGKKLQIMDAVDIIVKPSGQSMLKRFINLVKGES